MPPPSQRLLAVLACVTMCAAGCCCALCPRIDPTGESCFICPWNQPQAAVAAAPVAIAAAPSTVVAPPVGTDPVFPAPAAVAAGAPALATATPASIALANVPQDKVNISPERILAPVGSEVVLKASVCTTEGYTLADQKVEWMLGRNGVGQFVEVSGKGWMHPPLLPWNKPKKVDNYLATGWTSNAPLCVTRGTADPADDVNILRGDAWITVTSPNEGTSHVTAYMPTVESWDQRRANAVIYWVDVQWTFPPPTVAGGGRSTMLTTTVTRQTDGTPIEGYLVRYELTDGGGNLAGGGAGQVVEMRTNAQGQATVEATPTAAGASSTPVSIQLIRPAGYGGGDAPRLIVGSGASMIQWGGNSDYLSPSPPSATPSTPPPTLPADVPTTPGTWTPPPGTGGGIGSIPPARPQLEITLEGDQQATSGQFARLTMNIRNTGNAPATNVTVTDRFDVGLMYEPEPDAREVDFTGIGTIAPGETKRHTVTFNVMQAGLLCHNVTVRSAENVENTAQHCVTASAPAVQHTGGVVIRKQGPAQRIVGEDALFTITVENTGELPLVDLRIVDEYPTPFFTVQDTGDPSLQVVSGSITRTIPTLEVGQKREFRVRARCLQPAPMVVPRPAARVTARTNPPTTQFENADDVEMEILARREGAGAAASAAGPLKLFVDFFSDSARVGSNVTCSVTIVNTSTTADERVLLRLVLPPQLRPDMGVGAIQAPTNVQATLSAAGDQLTFSEIPSLPPGGRALYTIPMAVAGPATIANLSADVRSTNAPAGVGAVTRSLEVLSQ